MKVATFVLFSVMMMSRSGAGPAGSRHKDFTFWLRDAISPGIIPK